MRRTHVRKTEYVGLFVEPDLRDDRECNALCTLGKLRKAVGNAQPRELLLDPDRRAGGSKFACRAYPAPP